MILCKLRKDRIGGSLGRHRTEVSGLYQQIILVEDLNRVGFGCSEKAAPVDIHTDADFVGSQPALLGEFVIGQILEFLASPGPVIEIIAAVSLRCDHHVVRAVSMRVAVESWLLSNARA